jgi:hypothetical protein
MRKAREWRQEQEMTIHQFTEELRGYWSWLYEDYLSEFYEQYLRGVYARQWAPWELLAIAGALTIFLVIKIRRRRRKLAAKIKRLANASEEPPTINVKLTGGKEYPRNPTDSNELEFDRDYQRWNRTTEIVELSDHPVRQLRREIIKRDSAEARLERQVAELTRENERLQREVAEGMLAEERLERKFVELAAANERLQRQALSAGQVEETVSG